MESVMFEAKPPFSSRPVSAYLLHGHLDENEVRESLESELGDKEQVERIMRNTKITHTYGKPLPQGNWWLTNDPKPNQCVTPVTIVG
ncbi:hypothetical protein [Acinetobacter phage pB23]|nr:hypothetical protein [Acinetobacter phage pB23]